MDRRKNGRRFAVSPRYMFATIALTALGLSLLSARADEYPTLNVAPLCHGITDQSDLQAGFRSVSFDECMKAEQVDRETMIKQWSSFSADDKRHCIAEATMGGQSSYTDLVTCLEMARDVRALRKSNDQPQETGSARHHKRAKIKNPA
jgi:hypothetical protein